MRFAVFSLAAIVIPGPASAFIGIYLAGPVKNGVLPSSSATHGVNLSPTDLVADASVPQTYETLYLWDLRTRSSYLGYVSPAISSCTTASQCLVEFHEHTPGGYNFTARVYKNVDTGCHYINFQKALDLQTLGCCGALPCNIGDPVF